MATSTASSVPAAGIAPQASRNSRFLFGFPWWLLILALVLIWGIYLVLVGVDPVVLSRPADPLWTDVNDFEQMADAEAITLGVVEGSSPVTVAQEIVGEERLTRYPTFDEALAELQAGAIGGIVVEPFFGLNYARSNPEIVQPHADNYFADTFSYLSDGLQITLGVVLVAYTAAIVIGLIVGLIRANPPKPQLDRRKNLLAIPQLILYQAATLYVSVLRGLPILVTLLVTAFAIVPAVREVLIGMGVEVPRRLFLPAGIIALAIAYGAFLSETFRAGIQSIERGQIEAARSLGMSYFQVIRLVVLPQAIRRVLPPLGNDMIAMIKDTSLVSVLGVNDITQLATLWYSTTFRYPETLFILALMYLTMTIIGSLIVRWIETRLSIPGR
ncbi:MAG: ABC transporter substrate-binding protein/permease [Chloroflexota bacterium]|nr:ABC transporter substrate-binding protein/permease [Chloroflexota bacterium]